MRVFVTGSAGFIGFHVAKQLLQQGHAVFGFDGMTDYYDVSLKMARLEILKSFDRYESAQAMLEDRDVLQEVVSGFQPDVMLHLAAQAGVRYSIENPDIYISSNMVGTFNLLEAARRAAPRHLLFASTSSVYGANEELPFSETERTDFPVSLYAATKKAGEALSHSYAHLFKIPTTCFRFFTVYGPWGRPDMALFNFVEKIIERNEPIEVYGEGNMRRDFTYIDDLVRSIELLIDSPPEEGQPVKADGVVDSLSPVAPWRVVNIAGGKPVALMEFIETLEAHLGCEAKKKYLPMQEGDMPVTFADASLLKALTGYEPATPVSAGVGEFVKWYRGSEYVG